MEVRTVLATLLSRFWFEMAPSMGKPETVKKNQQIALTLKMKEGLSLVALPHEEELSRSSLKSVKSGGTWAARAMAAAARAPSGPLN
jgi:hypothetical protein